MLYTNTIATVIFVLVCGAWVASEFLGPVRWSGERVGKKRDQASLRVVIACGSVGLGSCFLFPVLLPAVRLPWPLETFVVGVVLALVGMGWRWYAIRTLGHYFTATLMLHPNQQVVQHGPYRWIRHPSYSGVLLIGIGLGLMLGNWLSLAMITAGLGAIVCSRIPREEQELLHHLGQDYQEYMSRTWRLIPFLF